MPLILDVMVGFLVTGGRRLCSVVLVLPSGATADVIEPLEACGKDLSGPSTSFCEVSGGEGGSFFLVGNVVLEIDCWSLDPDMPRQRRLAFVR